MTGFFGTGKTFLAELDCFAYSASFKLTASVGSSVSSKPWVFFLLVEPCWPERGLLCRPFNPPDLINGTSGSPYCFFFFFRRCPFFDSCSWKEKWLLMLSSYAPGSPGCLCPFPPCEGVKECPGFPSPLLPWASRENGAHCGLCPQAQPSASASGLLWPLCLVCCGYWVPRGQERGQSLPHVLPSIQECFWGMAHALCAPGSALWFCRVLVNILVAPFAGLSSLLQLIWGHVWRGWPAAPKGGWVPGHRRLGTPSKPFLYSESVGKHRINLFIHETGLYIFVFKIHFRLQLYLNGVGKIFWPWSTAELVEDMKHQNMILQVGETRGTQLFKKQICSRYRYSSLIIILLYQSGSSPDPRPVRLWKTCVRYLWFWWMDTWRPLATSFLGGCWLQTGSQMCDLLLRFSRFCEE